MNRVSRRFIRSIFSPAYALDSFHAQTDYPEVKERFYNFTEVIFSRKDSKLKLRQELEVEVERIRLGYLEQHPGIESKVIINYQHNPHYKHGGLQVADYIAYAVFQVFEKRNQRWYEIIKNKIGKIQDICNKKYYTRSNPLQLST